MSLSLKFPLPNRKWDFTEHANNKISGKIENNDVAKIIQTKGNCRKSEGKQPGTKTGTKGMGTAKYCTIIQKGF